MKRRLKGGCSCGAVRYELLDAPIRVNCCHCSNCQRQTGSAFVINMVIEAAKLRSRGRVEAVRMPRPKSTHDIYRCRKCKVAVWSDYGGRTWMRFVRAGTLDEPWRVKPDAHIFTKSKLPWVVLPKGARAFREYMDPAKVWPKKSLARWKAAQPRA